MVYNSAPVSRSGSFIENKGPDLDNNNVIHSLALNNLRGGAGGVIPAGVLPQNAPKSSLYCSTVGGSSEITLEAPDQVLLQDILENAKDLFKFHPDCLEGIENIELDFSASFNATITFPDKNRAPIIVGLEKSQLQKSFNNNQLPKIEGFGKLLNQLQGMLRSKRHLAIPYTFEGKETRTTSVSTVPFAPSSLTQERSLNGRVTQDLKSLATRNKIHKRLAGDDERLTALMQHLKKGPAAHKNKAFKRLVHVATFHSLLKQSIKARLALREAPPTGAPPHFDDVDVKANLEKSLKMLEEESDLYALYLSAIAQGLEEDPKKRYESLCERFVEELKAKHPKELANFTLQQFKTSDSAEFQNLHNYAFEVATLGTSDSMYRDLCVKCGMTPKHRHINGLIVDGAQGKPLEEKGLFSFETKHQETQQVLNILLKNAHNIAKNSSNAIQSDLIEDADTEELLIQKLSTLLSNNTFPEAADVGVLAAIKKLWPF